MLIDKILFSDKIPKLMKKSLDFISMRHLLITSNVSNVDTPGYKAHDINFQKQLKDALGSSGSLSMVATDHNHFGPGAKTIANLSPEPFEEKDAARSDGNNVDMDKEMGKLAENQILYNAITQLMMKRGSTVRSAVTELPQQ